MPTSAPTSTNAGSNVAELPCSMSFFRFSVFCFCFVFCVCVLVFLSCVLSSVVGTWNATHPHVMHEQRLHVQTSQQSCVQLIRSCF
jgi:hypothetical protein